VVEGEAELGELPVQLFEVAVEGRVDAGFGVAVERGDEAGNAVASVVIENGYGRFLSSWGGGPCGPPG